MTEPKIGEVIKFNGRNYEVSLAEFVCRGCAFYTHEEDVCPKDDRNRCVCDSAFRNDNKDVIFVERN